MALAEVTFKHRDFSYIKRFMMQAVSAGTPLTFSLHALKIMECSEPVYTFGLTHANKQECWPLFMASREAAIVKAVEFLTQYNCSINTELDIDEQCVQFAFNP